jgi:electron transfer flavoprotein-quinone oxidoreductase
MENREKSAHYDVAVVGAGCAGPAAALQAASMGLRTILLEKAAIPGEKNVSGTCLNTAALSDPDLHYLLDGPVEREIRSMKTYHITEGRTTVFHEIPSTGILLLSIRRDRFDAWHTERARKAGAEVRAVRGVVTDKGERILSRVVIDGGGVNSIVGRKAGLIPRRSGTRMILYVTAAVRLGKKKIDERFGNTIEYYLAPGCQYKTWPWIFPKRDVVTLGTGGYMTPELFDDGHPHLVSYMERFMDLLPVRERIYDGKIEAWGLHLEFDDQLPKHAKDGLILAGEAGGFVAPFLGEGMPEAFFTGIYAARAAAAGIKAGDLSAAFLEGALAAALDENLFLKSFMYVAQKNKESILAKPDPEIAEMMQSVVMGGGFITNVVHTDWMSAAETGDVEKAREAKDFLEFLQPYRNIGSDFEAVYAARKKK